MKQVKDESVWPGREKSSKHESTTADTRGKHKKLGRTSQQGTTHKADYEGLRTTWPTSHDRLRPDAVSPRRPGSSSAAGWPRHCLPSAPGELQCRRHQRMTMCARQCAHEQHPTMCARDSPDAVSPRRPGSSSAAGWPRHCLPSAPGELQCRRHHKPTSRFIRSCEKHRHKSKQLRAPQSHATQQHARRPPHWAGDPSKRV